jgi:polysaccharide pyruvyl transferase WcaK-like protein
VPAFFINAKTQHENLGDALITRELVNLARRQGPVSVLAVGVPEHFRRTLDLTESETVTTVSGFVVRMLKAVVMRKVNGGWVSGAVFYLLNPGGFEGEFSVGQTLRQCGLVATYVLLRLLGVRLMRVGCSLGPFGPRRLLIERLKARLLHSFTARDPISIEYAQANKLGLPVYFPDLAFLRPSPAQQRTAGSTPVIGISFRQLKGDPQYDAKIDTMLARLVATAPHGARYLVVTQVGFDQGRNREIAQRLGIAPHCDFVNVASDLDAAEAAYRGTDIVFSNRLHVLLIAMRQGARTIGLLERDKNRKIVGIFELLGLGHCIWDINRDTGQTYADALYPEPERAVLAVDIQSRQARTLFAQWVTTP